MALTKEVKSSIIAAHARSAGDTGSTEVQVALLTERINRLSEHLTKNRHDHHSHRGLLVLVGKRRRLLKYLEQSNKDAYKALIEKLGLRK
ncbi:30S ribosomal protein S15 [Calidithermus timidus]|jgi:small subunit ribosomal protein S15|uniref:30S ribosomal protein S15 n=1 Tax=Calidithermus timidus TaxID=307124 RepID=UPI00037287F4|nr:30S ribosomal protein S15 [Calidithermus timidus]